jgi:uncharacterized Zn finger protein
MAIVPGFTEADLRSAADGRSFERGWGYVDAVEDLEVRDGQVTATVYGTDDYEVVLTMDGDGLDAECDCPYGQDGNFCKHCVAVGLTVLRMADRLPAMRKTAATKDRSLEDWLDSLSREALLDLLREQLAQDKDLRRRLELRAVAAQADVTAVRARIRDLLDTRHYGRHGYVEYADAWAYSEQVGEAVEAIRALTEAGHADQAVAVARETIVALARVYENVDDSSGYLGGVADELGEVHLHACQTAGPDPVATAEWLVGHMLGPASYLPEIDADDYHDVLGETGISRLRELVTAAWRRNPSGWAEKRLMESLVRAEGDVDAIIAVYAADLSVTGSTHLAIARELDGASRASEALEWAERGLRDTAGQPRADAALVDYVAARYEQAGRQGDVVAVYRDRFQVERTLASYRRLRTIASRAGCWDTHRPAALDLLRADARTTGRYGAPVLIDALIDDGEIAAAWDAATGIASPAQWLTLAGRMITDRPADALGVYLRSIEPLRSVTGDANYQEMARLLSHARTCHQRLGTESEFDAYLAALRLDQRRKRNLMKILDQHGL